MDQKISKTDGILQNNRGFSLIELMVVVVIMIIAVGLVTISYTLVHNANVSKAANVLDTAFNKARIESMARGVDAGKLVIFMENGNLYYKISDTGEKTLICTSMIAVSIVSGSYTDTVGSLVSGTGTIAEYTFNSAGAVRTVASAPPTKFIFNRGNRTVEVVFYLETGKHETNLL